MISSRVSRCSIKPPHSCRSARLPGHQPILSAAGWHQFCILMLSAKGSLCRLLMYSVSPDWRANGAKKYIKNEQSTHLNCTHFNSQYYPWITHKGHENKVNDRQLKKLLVVGDYAYWVLFSRTDFRPAIRAPGTKTFEVDTNDSYTYTAHLLNSSNKVYNLSQDDICFRKVAPLIRFITAYDTNSQTRTRERMSLNNVCW